MYIIKKIREVALFGILSLLSSMTSSFHIGKNNPDLVIANGRLPKIVTDVKGNIHLAYGVGDSIMYATSSNQGASFSSPKLVAVLPELFANAMRGPQIAATINGIIITANTEYGNLYSYHNDAAGNWSKASKVNDVDSVSKEALTSLSADGSIAFAVWLDVRANGGKGQRLYGASSNDGGITWSKNIMIYASPDKSICECCKPSVLIKGNNIYAMFRNWLNGNRDLYLVQSSDGGKSFGTASKLGMGSWKLNGCPMDGGGLALGTDGAVETVWRREGNIYSSTAGKSETLLGEGRSCSMTSLNGKNFYTWTRNGDVIVMTPGKEVKILGKGAVPVINAINNEKVICVWENEKEIHASVLEL
ncbi:MAG: hypothetical protein ABIN89_06660 [Chitinophagaceae bacterium]